MGGISNKPMADPLRSSNAVLSMMTEVMGNLGQDASVYLLVGAYALVVYASSRYLHVSQKYQPFQYVLSWPLISLIFLVTIRAIHAIHINPRRPFSAFLVILREYRNRDFFHGIPLIFATAIFYGVFTSAKNMLPDIHAFTWDPILAAIDYRMLGGHDGWKIISSIIPEGTPIQVMDAIYTKVWLFFMLGLCAYASLSSDFRALRRRFLLTFFLSWIIAGNVLACMFMSGGPCFYADFTQDHLRFAGLLQSIGGTGSVMEQHYLWQAYRSHQGSLAAGISAFPSIHLVSTVTMALLAVKMNVRLFWASIILTVLMEIGSVRLGWHYVSDGLAGIAIAMIVWYFVGIVDRLHLKWRSTRELVFMSDQ